MSGSKSKERTTRSKNRVVLLGLPLEGWEAAHGHDYLKSLLI